MTAQGTSHIAGTPGAEVDIDEALARALLAAQHPDLASLPITPIASGWDNVIFRLGEAFALRLPRRQLAADLILHEQRWLPTLAGRLPLPIPAAMRIGAPQGRFPWAWSVVPWLAGETADLAPLDESEGAALGAFFKALHVPAPEEAPHNPYRGVPLAQRADDFKARIDSLARRGEGLDARILAIWDDALAAPNDAQPTWLHGDMHPRNVLVAGGRLAAVIDWGDIAKGDRASDLAGVWMLLPNRAGREAAMAACGPLSPATWRRARGWAVLYGAMLLDTGLADDPRMTAIALAIFQRLLDGP